MKIMLSGVGNRDAFAIDPNTQESSLGPLLTVAQEIKPDILIMFPTRKQLNDQLSYTEDRCDAIEAELKKMLPKIAVRKVPLDLSDPTDHHDILTHLIPKINEIKNYYSHSQPDYYIGISSATPQIQASFLLLVSSQRLNARLYQARDPHYVQAGQERVREIDVQFIEEENQINRSKIFYSKYYFSSAADEMTNIALSTRKLERSKLAEIYSDLLSAYHYIDLYQHERALESLYKVEKNLQRLRIIALLAIVKEQRVIVEQIIQFDDKEGFENLCDLYHNACRRFEMGQYIDCLSRFKRIYEGCWYYIAREELKIQPNRKLEDQRGVDWIYRALGRNRGNLNLYEIAELYEHKFGKNRLSPGLEDKLNSLAKKRNYTINNHGMRSVSHEDARQAIKLLKELLMQVFPTKNIDQYPFSSSKLEETGNIIFQNI